MAHGDYTGRQKALLAQKYANEQQLKASQMTLVSQVVQEGRQEVVDLTTDRDFEDRVQTRPDPTSDTGVVQVDLSEDPQFALVKFQASDTVEGVTVGKDRVFNLEEGQLYKAPRWIVEHLDRVGLVRH